MADDISGSVIFKLCVILLATYFNSRKVSDTILAAAQISIEPLWGSASKTSQCHVDTYTGTAGGFYLKGSEKEICSVRVIISKNTNLQLQISGRKSPEASSFIYIERDKDHEKCLSKYVVIGEQNETCKSIIITDTNIQIFLQGNTTLLIRDIPVIETSSSCAGEINFIQNNKNVSQISDCSDVKKYNQLFSCMSKDPSECKIEFPSNCGAIIGQREVRFEQCDYKLSENYTALITYQLNHVNIHVLDLSGNNIVQINDCAFEGLENVYDLNLRRNRLFTLGTVAIWGLTNLVNLNLEFNEISRLDIDSFLNLTKLKRLFVSQNMIKIIPMHTFPDLRKLTILDLEGNKIRKLNAGVFLGLGNLKKLSLKDNRLSVLSSGIFQDVPDVTILSLDDNQLTSLDAEVFVGLNSLKKLTLPDNLLRALPNGVFQGLFNLEILNLARNEIVNLSAGIFAGLSKLKELRPFDNSLTELPKGIFLDLQELEILYLSKNQLPNLPQDIFIRLQKLQVLVLKRIELHTLDTRIFHGLTRLELLSLGENNLTKLPKYVFEGLTNLKYLFLSNNKLLQIYKNIFKGLIFLQRVILSNNRLSHLDYDIFKDSVNLVFLDLSGNLLNEIPNIKHLTLENLYITNNTLLFIYKTTFSSFACNAHMLVSQHEICDCYVPSYVNCSAAYARSPYLTCGRLLSDRALAVLMWFIGFGAISGNMFVLIWRKRGAHEKNVMSILLRHLAASDFLMGIYMFIIASADIYFGNNFPMQSESWRSGITCRIAGAMSIISCEASVFFVTVISIERLIAITFPYSSRKLGKYSVKVVATVVWTISFVLGIVPSVLAGLKFKFYDNSHVCIGLPLSLSKFYVTNMVKHKRKFKFPEATVNTFDYIFTTHYKGLANGLFFSTSLFLGLNCVCYLIIVACYIGIVRQSFKWVGRSQAIRKQIILTMKVTTIVATDFFCWFPIIILGILVQIRVIELPASVYAWCVTFVLPINSAINPFLYTIAEIISDKMKKLSKSQNNYLTEQEFSVFSMSNTVQSTPITE